MLFPMAFFMEELSVSEVSVFSWKACGQILAAIITGIFGFYKAPALHEMKSCIKWIYYLGYPSILMQMLYTVYIVVLNIILAGFSDEAVTVLGLYYKMQTFFFIPLFGLETCIVPVLSYNYAAKKYQRCQIFCLIPLFWAFAQIGLTFSWIAFPLSEVIVGIVGVLLYLRQLHKWKSA